MASISQRGLYFRAKVSRTGFPVISKTLDTYDEALKWATEIERNFDLGLNDDFKNRAAEPTFEAGLERYSKEFTPRKRGSKQELRRIRTWQKSKLKDLKLSVLRPAHFNKVIADRKAAKISGSTLRSDLAVVSRMFRAAIRGWGFSYLVNPLKSVDRPDKNPARKRRLSKSEKKNAALAFAKYPNVWVGIVKDWGDETAMRQGEILKLLEDDLDIEGRRAFVRNVVAKNGEERTIGLSVTALAILARRPAKNDPRAFCVSISTIARAMKRMRNETGIKDYEFRDTRHEATSRLAERGLSAPEMQKITGHKTLKILQDYTHLNVDYMLTRLDATEPGGVLPKESGNDPLPTHEREELTRLRQENQRLWAEKETYSKANEHPKQIDPKTMS